MMQNFPPSINRRCQCRGCLQTFVHSSVDISAVDTCDAVSYLSLLLLRRHLKHLDRMDLSSFSIAWRGRRPDSKLEDSGVGADGLCHDFRLQHSPGMLTPMVYARVRGEYRYCRLLRLMKVYPSLAVHATAVLSTPLCMRQCSLLRSRVETVAPVVPLSTPSVPPWRAFNLPNLLLLLRHG